MVMRRTTLLVDGMTCSACVAQIERSLNAVDGVVVARVNYAPGRASVSRRHSVEAADLQGAVIAAGYGARLPEGFSDGHSAEPTRVHRLILAAGFGALVALLTMVDALAFDLGFQASDWLAAVLAAGVVFGSGWGFHRRAWAQLKHRTATMDTLVALGTAAAWIWSTVVLAAQIGDGHLYFETGAVIVVLILLGLGMIATQPALRRMSSAPDPVPEPAGAPAGG